MCSPDCARGAEAGITLIEVLIALIVLSLGILSLARVFPVATAAQLRSRMMTTGNYYTREKLEDLAAVSWSDTSLNAGRHPGGNATENLGTSSAWHRYYNVTVMAAPLQDLKLVSVTVRWRATRMESTTTTTYLRQ